MLSLQAKMLIRPTPDSRVSRGSYPRWVAQLGWLFVLVWIVGSTASCRHQVRPLHLTLEQRLARVDALLADSGHISGPGTAALITIDGDVVYRSCRGLANLDTGAPITAQTNFRLASVSKQITAMSIMILAEEGRLDYDDSMIQYLPKLEIYGSDITLRDLLVHTAGLPDVYDLLPAQISGRFPNNSDLIPALVDIGEPLFEAGQRFDYCNVCYDMLAMVVEKVSGQTFDTFLQHRIFDPLEMTRSTTYQCPEPLIPQRALGYRPQHRTFVEYDADSLNCILGAGGIYSNLEDLHRWNQGLETETLVSHQALQEAFTPGTLDSGELIDYGFGWTLDTYRGVRRASHTGSWVGFRNYTARYPDAGLTIILLSNRSDFERQRLAEQLADLYLDLSLAHDHGP